MGFVDILHFFVYIVAVWTAGRAMRAVSVSSIIGELAVGIALGPQVANWVPFEHSLETFGAFGVTLLIFESGMHLNLKKVREFGARSFAVALLGTLTPILFGTFTMNLLGFDLYPDGLSVGCALAPTSVGIALSLLTEAKLLDSDFGQIIVTAAFMDDILSIITLVVLLDTGAGSITVWGASKPFLLSFLFVAGGWLLAEYFMPWMMPLVLRKLNSKSAASVRPRDELHLAFMVTALLLCGWLASFVGSHLLGAFMAGVLFTDVPRSMLVWRRQFKKVIHWLVRLFFAASVAFIIPVSSLFALDALWKGMVLGLFGAMAPKLLSAVFLGDKKWVVGWAMVARGEFAYLVAQVASETEYSSGGFLLSKDAFAVAVWALLMTTVVSPFIFRYVLVQYTKKTQTNCEEDPLAIELRVEGYRHTGMLREVVDVLFELELEVVQAHIESDLQTDVEVFTVMPRLCGGPTKTISKDKIHELRHKLLEAIDDDNAQIIISPIDMPDPHEEELALAAMREFEEQLVHDKDGDDDDDDEVKTATSRLEHSLLGRNRNTVEIRIMSGHHPGIFKEIVEALVAMDMHVERAQMQDVRGTDFDVIYARDHDVRTVPAVRRQAVHDAIKAILKRHGQTGSVLVKILQPHFLDEHWCFREKVLAAHKVYDELKFMAEVRVDVDQGVRGAALLPLMTGALSALGLDILSADIDAEDGIDVFFVKDTDQAITSARVANIRLQIRQRLFHAATFAEVDVLPCTHMSPVKLARRAPESKLKELVLDSHRNHVSKEPAPRLSVGRLASSGPSLSSSDALLHGRAHPSLQTSSSLAGVVDVLKGHFSSAENTQDEMEITTLRGRSKVTSSRMAASPPGSFVSLKTPGFSPNASATSPPESSHDDTDIDEEQGCESPETLASSAEVTIDIPPNGSASVEQASMPAQSPASTVSFPSALKVSIVPFNSQTTDIAPNLATHPVDPPVGLLRPIKAGSHGAGQSSSQQPSPSPGSDAPSSTTNASSAQPSRTRRRSIDDSFIPRHSPTGADAYRAIQEKVNRELSRSPCGSPDPVLTDYDDDADTLSRRRREKRTERKRRRNRQQLARLRRKQQQSQQQQNTQQQNTQQNDVSPIVVPVAVRAKSDDCV